jgi:hypothetical protein
MTKRHQFQQARHCFTQPAPTVSYAVRCALPLCCDVQVVRLMRMLVQLCQTLDKVPDEVRQHREAVLRSRCTIAPAMGAFDFAHMPCVM